MELFASILETATQYYWLLIVFFFIAILYSSVGFGGGSSYLAVLSLTLLTFTEIRTIALLCNIVVVTSGTIMYAKNGFYNWKKVVPLVAFSIPMAFFGGYLKISQTFFFVLLGSTLLFAAFFMWISKYISETSKKKHKKSLLKDTFFGGIIGFISGMVGIGGGIFLAPLLYLTNWDTPKKIAATSSFFILVNSIAGLVGQTQNPNFSIEPTTTLLLLVVVFIGGQIGSRMSIKKITPFVLKKITAVLIVIVGLRILWKYLF